MLQMIRRTYRCSFCILNWRNGYGMQDLNIKNYISLTRHDINAQSNLVASNSSRCISFQNKRKTYPDSFMQARQILWGWTCSSLVRTRVSSPHSSVNIRTSLRDMTIGTDIVPIAGDAVPEVEACCLIHTHSARQAPVSSLKPNPCLAGDQRAPVLTRRRHSKRHNQYVFFRA